MVPIVDLLIGAVDLVFFLSSSLSQGTTSMANPNFKCTLRFGSVLPPSLLLFLPCVNGCIDLEPHVWIGHQSAPKVPAIAGTSDPLVATPSMFLHPQALIQLSFALILSFSLLSYSDGL